MLRIQYPAEPIAWIGNPPEGTDLGIILTFGQLTNADGASVSNLACYLGLSPASEDDRLGTLNKVMQHLGVSRRLSIFFANRSQNDHRHSDRVQGSPLARGGASHAHKSELLMKLAGVSLYVLLTYLTMFVYFNVAL